MGRSVGLQDTKPGRCRWQRLATPSFSHSHTQVPGVAEPPLYVLAPLFSQDNSGGEGYRCRCARQVGATPCCFPAAPIVSHAEASSMLSSCLAWDTQRPLAVVLFR